MPSRRETGHGARGWLRFLTSNNRVRLMLTLELAVMLPAAALIYVNFYHLKSIRRDKVLEAAIHRDFLQMLAISEKQLNLKAYKLAEDARELFPSVDLDDTAKIQKLDAVLSGRPWLAHAFIFDPEHGLLFRSQPERMDRDAWFLEEHRRLSKMYGGWLVFEAKTMLEGLRKRSRPVNWYADQSKRPGGSLFMTTAFFTVPRAPKDRVAIGGVSLDPEYLKKTFFPDHAGRADRLQARRGGRKPARDGRLSRGVGGRMGWSPPAGGERAECGRRVGGMERGQTRGVTQPRRRVPWAGARHQVPGDERGGARTQLGLPELPHSRRALAAAGRRPRPDVPQRQQGGRAGAAEVRLRVQRLARAPHAAVADPALRGDARARARQGAGQGRASTTGSSARRASG